MKKVLLSAVALLAFGFANAQDKKEGGAGLASGNIVLTGDLNYTSTSQDEVKSSVFGLAPGVGYMMSDNLMLLGSIGISTGTVSSPGTEDVKINGLGLNAGVRYFFTPADKFSLSIGGQLGYGSISSNLGVDEFGDQVVLAEDVKTSTISFNVPVGLHYFMNDNFAITTTFGGLGYSSSKEDTDGAEAKNTFGLNLNMSSLSFGLLYKL
jgi:outer membrane protein